MSTHDAAPVFVTEMSAKGCDMFDPANTTAIRVRSARHVGGDSSGEPGDDCDEEAGSEGDRAGWPA